MHRSPLAVPAIAFLCFAGLPGVLAAEAPVEEPSKLLGRCSVEQLRAEPFAEWFDGEYDGDEVARIVEFPALSLERDLLTILSGAEYQPN